MLNLTILNKKELSKKQTFLKIKKKTKKIQHKTRYRAQSQVSKIPNSPEFWSNSPKLKGCASISCNNNNSFILISVASP
jgi:hypothetical protein